MSLIYVIIDNEDIHSHVIAAFNSQEDLDKFVEICDNSGRLITEYWHDFSVELHEDPVEAAKKEIEEYGEDFEED